MRLFLGRDSKAPASMLSVTLFLALFGITMGYFEAAVVVYLREIVYPGGFHFPLKTIRPDLLTVELGRELASLIMLVSVASLVAKSFYERLGYFMVSFGIWDIFYYIFLKIILGWPHSMWDWDILFLIPLPWIGPVIAPITVSILLVLCGWLIIKRYVEGEIFFASKKCWAFAVLGSIIILSSFMMDLGATLQQKMPKPYPYWLLTVGEILTIVSFWQAYRSSTSGIKIKKVSS